MPTPRLTDVQFARISKAIAYLYNQQRLQPSLQQVADVVHVSPDHLQRQFTQWVGVSPKKLLQFLTLEHAKQLLSQQTSILAASDATGLSSSSRLHDLFIQLEGMTPGEYKQAGAGLVLHYAYLASPFGSLLAAASNKGLCYLSFVDQPETALEQLKTTFANATWRAEQTPILQQVQQLLLGLPLDKPLALHVQGTAFQLKVWQALLSIPQGQLRSYGQLAQQLDQANASRAVGTAIGKNPIALLIPCHRVIRASGVIGEYRWQQARKLALIGWEQAHAH